MEARQVAKNEPQRHEVSKVLNPDQFQRRLLAHSSPGMVPRPGQPAAHEDDQNLPQET